ncbi:hypothetical protein Goshw_025684 [Gossypium schwendimanii]|uniref:Uncharacterized protein n=1 Tax=Gossypium schwendimanii TaxID=34291 RepID=A0A7J9NF78_GOSSC|nr:hypothetical protein [Gossypium schwendimanii]
MKEIWNQWDDDTKQLLHYNYGDLPYLFSVKGLVIFPKALGYIDEVVPDLFDRLSKGVTPVLAILAETFRSLNAYRRAGEGSYSPLEELVATPRRDDISKEKWMAILQNLRDEDVEWRSP